MYDCADLMKVKLTVLEKLGIDEEVIACYCPGSPPSQDVNTLNSLINLQDLLEINLKDTDLTYQLLMDNAKTCPYCEANSECPNCAFRQAFGCSNSHRGKVFELLIKKLDRYESITPDRTTVIEAINYITAACHDLVIYGELEETN